MDVAVVVGNPKAQSRTLGVALAAADALTANEGKKSDRLVIDLADIASEIFDFESSAVKRLLEAAAGSDLLVVASPTYKATFTGLLKSFLDRYMNDALANTVAVPVMTGAAPIHALAPEVHLRPLLVELGASTPTRGLYVTEEQFHELEAVVGAWATSARPLVAGALATRSAAAAGGA
jgi:FMN reductase